MYLITLRDQIAELDDLVEQIDSWPPEHSWCVLDFAQAFAAMQLVADIIHQLADIQKMIDGPYKEAQDRCRKEWLEYARRASDSGWSMTPGRWEHFPIG